MLVNKSEIRLVEPKPHHCVKCDRPHLDLTGRELNTDCYAKINQPQPDMKRLEMYTEGCLYSFQPQIEL